MEDISSSFQVAGMKLDNLGKAYDLLQSQASSLLVFSLQWKDLQEHFDSIGKSIGDRLESLNVRVKEVELKENQFIVTQEKLNECTKMLNEKEERLSLVQKSLDESCEKVVLNGKKLEEIKRMIQETTGDLQLKEGHLASIKLKIQDHVEELEYKQKEREVLQKSITESSAQLEMKEQELAVVQKSFGEYQTKLQGKEGRLHSLEKDIEGRSKELENKENQLSYVQRQLRSRRHDFELKDREYGAILKRIQERDKELVVMEEQLKSIQKSICEREKHLRFKDEECKRDQRMIEEFKGLISEHENVLQSVQRTIEECTKDIGAKEERLNFLEDSIKIREREIKSKDSEFQELKNNRNGYEKREGQLKSIQKQITQCEQELKRKEKTLDSVQKSIFGLTNELESKRKNLNDLVAKEEELKSTQRTINQDIGELESSKKDFDSLNLQMKERSEELETNQNQFEERVRKFELEEKQFQGQVEKLKLKEKQFEERVQELELKGKQFESLRKSIKEEKVLTEMSDILYPELKTEQLDFTDSNNVTSRRNVLQLLNETVIKYELVSHEVSSALRESVDPAKLVLDAMLGFYPPHPSHGDIEYDANNINRSCILLLDELKKSTPVISSHVKEESLKLASEWRKNMSGPNKDCLEVLGFLKFVATYELGSSFNANELQKLLNMISQHCQASELRKALGIIDNVPGPAELVTSGADGIDLQLLSNQQRNAPELMVKDTLVDFQASDPAKLVLDLLQNPIIQKSRKGGENAIIVGGLVGLLEWLKAISPDIKPHVREEAMKLALELKAEMRASTENSLEVLGFLLLLSIYGLVPYFKEDEILQLFEIAAHHKQAVELFGTLGFADKVFDFVQNLIKKHQPLEAVRFICAYKLVDKIPPVDLLKAHVQNAKMNSQRLCKNKPFEIKDKVRDDEVACLRTVLKFILDNNIESQNLPKEIQFQIDNLERLKKANRGGGHHAGPSSSSKAKAQAPDPRKRSNEAVGNKHQVKPSGNSNKRPRNFAATPPSVTPVFTPIQQPMFRPHHETLMLPNGSKFLYNSWPGPFF